MKSRIWCLILVSSTAFVSLSAKKLKVCQASKIVHPMVDLPRYSCGQCSEITKELVGLLQDNDKECLCGKIGDLCAEIDACKDFRRHKLLSGVMQDKSVEDEFFTQEDCDQFHQEFKEKLPAVKSKQAFVAGVVLTSGCIVIMFAAERLSTWIAKNG